MKLTGFLLLVSGWGIMLAALSLLGPGPLTIFILLGLGVEILGLALVVRGHRVRSGGGA